MGIWAKRVFFIFFFLSGILYSQTLLSQAPPEEVKSPSDYGNIVLGRYAWMYEPKSLEKVVFPHWFHRIRFRCKVCHSDIGFAMKAGSEDIMMMQIFEGKWCGVCHNNKIAFSPLNCGRCHSLGVEVTKNHKIEDILNDLPGNTYGNNVDWVKAIEDEIIQPKASLHGQSMEVFDNDIEIMVKVTSGDSFPNVIFPHKAHTQWLSCNSCHPGVFQRKASSTDMSMDEIFEGKFCGMCHGKVAFPLSDCFRCHSKIE